MAPEAGRAVAPPLRLLAINLTRRCNLGCAHCYLDADTLRRGDADELSTAQVCALLDDVAAMRQGTMVVLTGGEPLLREDLETIVGHGAGLGLPMVLGTNATLLGAARLDSLQRAGLLGLGISLDSLDPAVHDGFRGHAGAWTRTMAAIERCRARSVSFQLHFSVTERNAHELSAMVDFAHGCGARALNVFFVVCVGRGRSLAELAPQRYETLLRDLIDAQERHPGLIVRPRCAPQYKRIAHQLRPQAPINRIGGRDGDGCIAGVHYARVNHRGGVTACPYIEHEVGNIRQRALSAWWADAGDFARLRAPQLAGRCGACEYRLLCGGCRARPVAAGGDLMDGDELCTYRGSGAAPVPPLPAQRDDAPRWSADAEQRLARVPTVLRTLVRTRAESYVAGRGETLVTARHLSELVAARFGAGAPARPTMPGDAAAGRTEETLQ